MQIPPESTCIYVCVCVCVCVCVNYVMKDDKIGGARSKHVGDVKCIHDFSSTALGEGDA